MKYLRVFALAVLAGVMIALGGLAYVACCAYETTGVGKILGSVLFSAGLLSVCAFGLFLYTGRIGYAFEKKADYLLALLVGYIGNIIGACGIGYLCFATAPFTSGKMGAVVESISSSRDILNQGETWYSALLLGVLCGILVFVGVDLFKTEARSHRHHRFDFGRHGLRRRRDGALHRQYVLLFCGQPLERRNAP